MLLDFWIVQKLKQNLIFQTVTAIVMASTSGTDEEIAKLYRKHQIHRNEIELILKHLQGITFFTPLGCFARFTETCSSSFLQNRMVDVREKYKQIGSEVQAIANVMSVGSCMDAFERKTLLKFREMQMKINESYNILEKINC